MNDGFTTAGRPYPDCRGSKISRARSVIQSTATLLARRRMVSPIAIGLRVPLGLRRAMIEAPQTYGLISSGTSPLSKRLTTSERSRRSRSDEAGRIASRTWEGRRPDRPAPEVEGKDQSALRTWSESAEGAAPGKTLRRDAISALSSSGGPG